MMKKIVLGVVVLVAAFVFIFKDKISDVFYTCDLPEPTTIAFEKQLPLYSYDWNLIGPTGQQISFVLYMDRNVIVNYWSPNSKDSVEELKAWSRLYEDYKNEIFFIFVANGTQAEVNKFVKDNDYVFPIYYSSGTPLRSIVLDVTPKTYLITKSGRIVVNHTGAANWNSDAFRKSLDEVIKQNK